MFGKFNTVKLVKKKKRIGRGGHRGKSSGRGRGGQYSRSGSGSEIGVFFSGGQMPLSRSVPRRGFTSMTDNVFEIVKLSDLEMIFAEGANVGVSELRAKGLLSSSERSCKIKLLANGGVLSKSLHVSVNAISATARLIIERAGGSVSII